MLSLVEKLHKIYDGRASRADFLNRRPATQAQIRRALMHAANDVWPADSKAFREIFRTAALTNEDVEREKRVPGGMHIRM